MDYKIPLKKQSKKNRREYFSKMRRTWDISPIPRVVPNKKKNNRKETEELSED